MKRIVLDSVDSTNAYLKRNYEMMDDLTFVSSYSQSAGRGRGQRKWESEEGKNLTFSYLLKDRRYLESYRQLSVLSAYSLVKILEEYGVKGLGIKWPNDVYVFDKKLAGILLESVSRQAMECLIIGIGINVNQEEFLFDGPVKAISLKNIIGSDIDIAKLRDSIYIRILNDLENLLDGHDFYKDIKEYDYLKGRRAYAMIGEERCLVKILGIDSDYSLKVSSKGETMNLFSGEISFHIE